MNILCVAPMGSGKDTVAALLPGYQRLALGDEIRLAAQNLRINGVAAAKLHLSQLMKLPGDADEKLLELQQIQSIDGKQREVLQQLGTWAREHDDYVWINTVKSQIRPNRNYCITDVRRLVELHAFPGFKRVFISTALDVRISRLLERDGAYDPAWEQSKSELEIQSLKPMCDYVLYNNGSIDELKKDVDYMIDWFIWDETN